MNFVIWSIGLNLGKGKFSNHYDWEIGGKRIVEEVNEFCYLKPKRPNETGIEIFVIYPYINSLYICL